MEANLAADFLCKTLDPENPAGPLVDAVFRASLTLRYYKYSPVRYMNLIASKFVLEHPQRIFYGVREFNEGGWCYTARPAEWYIREHQIEAFPDDMVFAVYLNPAMRVYECRAEYSAADDPMAPIDWEKRYRGVTWRTIP